MTGKLLDKSMSIKCISISLGLVQLYSIPIPVYGPHHYTTFEKKINVEANEQSGSGANDDQTETEVKSDPDVSEKDSVLDKLNEKKKVKLDSSIYSSFLHPNQIETSSISIGGLKRKLSKAEPSKAEPSKAEPSKIENDTGSGRLLQQTEMNKKRKISEPKHKFHLI